MKKKDVKSDENVQAGDTRTVMDEAKEVLECIKRDAEVVKGMVEQEMQNRFGAKWKIWVGFHSVPSME
jgi:aprataxin